MQTVVPIDRVTRSMLHQLELQTQAALAILEHAPEEKRDALLADIAEVPGRLVRLRARFAAGGGGAGVWRA